MNIELERFREWAQNHLESFISEQAALAEEHPEDYKETSFEDFIIFYVESF